MHPDAKGQAAGEQEVGSDAESQAADDDLDIQDTERAATPPRAAGLEGTSAPPTPARADNKALAPAATEGKETKDIRHRVEALEWEDGKGPAPKTGKVAAPGTGDDTEIADVASQVAESAEMVQDEDKKQEEQAEDVEIANVADEVSESAVALAKEDKKEEDADVEIADVAAEVGASAKAIDQKDEEDKDKAEVAADVAESSKVVAEEEPVAPTPPAVQTVSVAEFALFVRFALTSIPPLTVLLCLLFHRIALLIILLHRFTIRRRPRTITTTS